MMDDRPAPRQGPGTGNPDEHLVPWKFLQGDEVTETAPITLYWIPASLDQAEKSALMRSEKLVDASSRCVALRIVLPEKTIALKKLGVAGRSPAAVIVDRKGAIVRESKSGDVSRSDVERMVGDELAAREEAVYRDLHEAGALATAGNNAAAIALYQKIWDDRCLFSMFGNEAQRALKRLGVIVKETPAPPPPDPNLQPAKKPAAH
jgi:hypothetical protein